MFLLVTLSLDALLLLPLLLCSCWLSYHVPYFYSSHHVCFIALLFIFLFKLSCFFDILFFLFHRHFDSLISNWYPTSPPPTLCRSGKRSLKLQVFSSSNFFKKIQAQVFSSVLSFPLFVCFFVVVFHCVCLLVSILHLFVFEVFIYLHMFCILIISSCLFVVCRVTFHTLWYFFNTLYFLHRIFFFYDEKRREKWVIFSL